MVISHILGVCSPYWAAGIPGNGEDGEDGVNGKSPPEAGFCGHIVRCGGGMLTR